MRGFFAETGILAILLLARPALALDPTIAVTQYLLDVYQTEQGLPQNTVQAITQDHDGYLWFGTQEGLARFDGVQFTVFDQHVWPELRHSSVLSILEDHERDLWFGTTGGGLYRVRKGHVDVFDDRHGLGEASIWSLLEMPDGSLWITSGSGVARYKNGAFTRFTTQDGLSSDDVRSVCADNEGALWFGTTGGGVSRLKDGHFTSFSVKEGLLSDTVRIVTAAREGGIWAATSGGGLCRIQGGKVTTYGVKDGLPTDQLYTVREDRQGNLWVGTWGSGLCRFRDGRFTTFSTKDGLSNDHIWSLYEDREGSLWVGTWVGGVNRLKDGKFVVFTTHEGLSNDNVRVVLEGRDGSVWIGTAGGGLNRLKNGKVTVYREKDGLSSDQVSALWEDREGNLWIGTNLGGVNRFRDGKFTVYSTAQGLPSYDVRAIRDDAAGNVWVGTIGGLARITGGKVFLFSPATGQLLERVVCIYEDRSGALWFGTSGLGVIRLKDGVTTTFTTKQGLGNGRVMAIHEDPDGSLWFGTSGGGLSHFVGEKFTTFGTRDGLFDGLVQTVLDDRLGNFWMTSNRGVFRVAKADLAAFAAGKLKTIPCVSYSTADGLRSNGFSGGQSPPACRTRDGRLWFASFKGLAVIDPAHIPFNSGPPNVAVEAVVADGEALDLTRELSLRPGVEKLEVHYTALSLLVPERVRFRFLLEGLDHSWVDAGTRRVAYYTNVPHGRYTFRVVACNNDGVWNERGAAIALSLRPFFTQTWWFRGSVALAVLAAAVGVTRLRVASLKRRAEELSVLVEQRTLSLQEEKRSTEQALRGTEQAWAEARRQTEIAEAATAEAKEANRAKSQFLANMSHELRTPLNAIMGYSEMLDEEAKDVGLSAFRQDLQRIQAAAKHQLELVNDILDLSKIEAGKMELLVSEFSVPALIEGVTAILQPLLQKNGNTLVVDGSESAGLMESDETKVRQSLFNLLSNACKFTEHGTVTLALSRQAASDREWISFRVTDTGIGMTEEQLSRLFQPFTQADSSTSRRFGGTGLGLTITRHFSQMMGGELSVASSPGHGTSFTLRLPARLPNQNSSGAPSSPFRPLDRTPQGR